MGTINRHYGGDYFLTGMMGFIFAMGGTLAGGMTGLFFNPDEETPKGEKAAQVQRQTYTQQVDNLIEREKNISATERLLLLTDPAAKPDVAADLQKAQKERLDFSRDFYKVAFNLVLDPALVEEDSKALAKRLVDNTNSPLPAWYVDKSKKTPLRLETTFLHECRAELGALPTNVELAAEKLNSCSLEKDSSYATNVMTGSIGTSMALYLGIPFLAAARRRRAEKKEEKLQAKKYQGHVPPREMPDWPQPPAQVAAQPVVKAKPTVKINTLNLD